MVNKMALPTVYSQPGHLEVKAGLCPGQSMNTQCVLKAPEGPAAGPARQEGAGSLSHRAVLCGHRTTHAPPEAPQHDSPSYVSWSYPPPGAGNSIGRARLRPGCVSHAGYESKPRLDGAGRKGHWVPFPPHRRDLAAPSP